MPWAVSSSGNKGLVSSIPLSTFLVWPLLHTVPVDGYCHTQSHSVGLRWTSYRPVAEKATRQCTTSTSERKPCSRRIRTRSPSKRAAKDLSLRSHGYRDRPVHTLYIQQKSNPWRTLSQTCYVVRRLVPVLVKGAATCGQECLAVCTVQTNFAAFFLCFADHASQYNISN